MANVTTEDGANTFKLARLRSMNTLPAGLTVFFIALNIFLSITASLGNTLILIALHKVTSIHPPTKLLFRCLAVTDLCVGLISLPLFVLTLVITFVAGITDMNRNLLYYSDQVNSASGYALFAVSVLTSTAISVDRFLALFLGLRYTYVLTVRRVGVVVICFWLLSCTLGAWRYSAWGRDIARTVLIILMLLSLSVSLFSYIRIYLRLRLRHRQIQLQPQIHQGQLQLANGGETPLNIARYKKTVSTIAWVQLVLLACYIPFSVFGTLLSRRKLPESVPGMATFFLVVVSLLYLNSSLNPILNCWKIREVRQAVKDTIRQL
ncbi:hypothetical protein ACROYT_G001714 [Oculina patagonica]